MVGVVRQSGIVISEPVSFTSKQIRAPMPEAVVCTTSVTVFKKVLAEVGISASERDVTPVTSVSGLVITFASGLLDRSVAEPIVRFMSGLFVMLVYEGVVASSPEVLVTCLPILVAMSAVGLVAVSVPRLFLVSASVWALPKFSPVIDANSTCVTFKGGSADVSMLLLEVVSVVAIGTSVVRYSSGVTVTPSVLDTCDAVLGGIGSLLTVVVGAALVVVTVLVSAALNLAVEEALVADG